MTEEKLPQLKCQICDTNRTLTIDEIAESIVVMKRRNLKPDQILNIWSVYDGDTCPEGGNHSYEWNSTFRENVMNLADKRKKADGEIVRCNNRCEELTKADEKADVVLQQHIAELTVKRAKEKEEMCAEITEHENTIAEQDRLKPELEDEIMKTSGRDWKGWL